MQIYVVERDTPYAWLKPEVFTDGARAFSTVMSEYESQKKELGITEEDIDRGTGAYGCYDQLDADTYCGDILIEADNDGDRWKWRVTVHKIKAAVFPAQQSGVKIKEGRQSISPSSAQDTWIPSENPLWEKWARLYPPIPDPQHSQVCDGYSCMWCGRCPRGDNWKVPEEDKAAWDEYQMHLAEHEELLLEELERLLTSKNGRE